jgi:hypothetical protein
MAKKSTTVLKAEVASAIKQVKAAKAAAQAAEPTADAAALSIFDALLLVLEDIFDFLLELLL